MKPAVRAVSLSTCGEVSRSRWTYAPKPSSAAAAPTRPAAAGHAAAAGMAAVTEQPLGRTEGVPCGGGLCVPEEDEEETGLENRALRSLEARTTFEIVAPALVSCGPR